MPLKSECMSFFAMFCLRIHSDIRHSEALITISGSRNEFTSKFISSVVEHDRNKFKKYASPNNIGLIGSIKINTCSRY